MRTVLTLILAASIAASPVSITRIACLPETETGFSCDDSDFFVDPSAIPSEIDWFSSLPVQILPLAPAPFWVSCNSAHRVVLPAILPARPDAPRGPPPLPGLI